MKKINIVLLTAVLAMILLAVEVVIVKNLAKYEPQTTVVFSKERIPENTIVMDSMLIEKKIAADLVPDKTVSDIKDVVGKRVKSDIEKGEMLLSSKLFTSKSLDLAEKTTDGSRLFSIEFKADQVNGWWLVPGQLVDILFIPDIKSDQDLNALGPQNTMAGTNNKKEVIDTRPDYDKIIEDSCIIRLSGIRIAAVIDEKGKILTDFDRTTLPRYISFEVSGDMDEFLAWAKTNGRFEISVIPQIITGQ
jgi:Flp pilus assembly protein CpaB